MVMTRWDPFLRNELGRFQDEVNQLFGRFGLASPRWPGFAPAYPPVNVWEDADHVYVEAELPGLERDQFEIYVTEGNQLTLQGERRPFEAEQGVWHRQERGFGKFSRVVVLPAAVEADRVEAHFEHGVLHLTLPKSEAAKPRRITVKAE